jgi:Zn-dependent protease
MRGGDADQHEREGVGEREKSERVIRFWRRSPVISPPMLAIVNFTNPVAIAVIIGWTMTVVLHEWAHGIVGHIGGDYTVRERGGLTLNPIQYMDTMNSFVYPLIFMAMGALPLMGGATCIRRDLLRSKYWSSAVSLAGPAMNFIIFFALVLPLHPKIGWVHPSDDALDWTNGQKFLATMAVLQFFAACFNLLPVPSVDGFNAISPYLNAETQEKLNSPMVRQGSLLVLFLIMVSTPGPTRKIFAMMTSIATWIGFDPGFVGQWIYVFEHTMWG